MTVLVLVINLGSSSFKASLVDSTGAKVWYCNRKRSTGESVSTVLNRWLTPVLERHRHQIQLIGHRVVHGGEDFTSPTLITPQLEHALQMLIPLAPLHQPPALAGLAWTQRLVPDCPQWACFDTAFHRTLPTAASTYAIPQKLRDKGLHRYGFHGINHQYVSEYVADHWRTKGRDPSQLRLISAHLGAGSSLAAVKGGNCIDTTMGFTPLEGLVMETRSGSIDPGLILELIRQGYGETDLSHLLQDESGLKGLSGLSGDMREIRELALEAHPGAVLALAVFRHRLLQQLGAMAASLQGVDVLALTGGIGQHDDALRIELNESLKWWGAFETVVVPADEEGMIARLCLRHQFSLTATE
jgi:acetate kinase